VTRFHFRLQRVMEWREKQLELEEARLKQRTAEVSDIDRTKAAVEAEVVEVETRLRKGGAVFGQDLAALSGYRRHVQLRIVDLAKERAQAVERLAAQEAAMLEARRRCRLLERLKERRLAEWESARDKELEEVASESYLSRWVRDSADRNP
jgi:flagellar export protein FliJ